MKERPILFSAPMVRALLDGSKTQTRRIITEQMPEWATFTDEEYTNGREFFMVCGEKEPSGLRPIIDDICCPYGQYGDRLWVRETWAPHPDFPESARRAVYRADPECKYDVERWRPSIHMPRWASRILLEITGVRVERLQDISEADALAEGIKEMNGRFTFNEGMHESRTPQESYRALWESIGGAGSWDDNPWVWVIEFKRVTP